LIGFLTGCASNPIFNNSSAKAGGVQSENFLSYQPIAPLPAIDVDYFNSTTNAFEKKKWASFTDSAEDKKAKKKLLPLLSTYTYISKNDVSGSASFLSNGAKLKKGDYTVISDFILYRVERVPEKGVGLVGVGMRIRAKIHTTESNLNLGGFFDLALAAKAGNLTGELQVDVIGITSDEIIQIFPALSTEINQVSIQNVMQALASIKAKMSEDDVNLTPHLLAFQQKAAGNKTAIITSLAYAEGLAQGKVEKNKIQEIVKYIGSDANKWKALIDSSKLDSKEKQKLKKVAVQKIEKTLTREAAINSGILEKLNEAYQKTQKGGK